MKRGRKEVGRPVETTLRVIAGRWKVMILYYLMLGTKRFNELHRMLKGVSHRTLAQQLRELERDGILHRKVYPQIPPKVEYSLTERGASLKPVLIAMHKWGEAYASQFGLLPKI
jgi:DNA-binding HxlR family transcriptional regulator